MEALLFFSASCLKLDKKYSSAPGFSPVWFVHLQVDATESGYLKLNV